MSVYVLPVLGRNMKAYGDVGDYLTLLPYHFTTARSITNIVTQESFVVNHHSDTVVPGYFFATFALGNYC